MCYNIGEGKDFMNTNLINPLVLAYIGDAIYELEIRTRLVNTKINKVNDLQKESIKYVSAKSQANYINVLIDANAPPLTTT